MGNFIKIDRKILKWEWWSDINTYRLFTYMLIVAYWKNGKYKGKDIPRGSFPSSLSELSKETNLTENEVRTAIKHLKSTGEITSKPHNKFTIFTIKNYELYQSDNKQNNNKITSEITNYSQDDNKQITFKPHSIDELLTKSLLKEDKEYKNIENEEEREEGKKEKKDTYLSERKQIIDYLNQKCGTKYRHGSDLNKKCMNARLNEGYKVEDFFEVIDKKYDDWHGTEREKYLRPETLFGNKFEGYLNQSVVKEKGQTEQMLEKHYDMVSEWARNKKMQEGNHDD